MVSTLFDRIRGSKNDILIKDRVKSFILMISTDVYFMSLGICEFVWKKPLFPTEEGKLPILPSHFYP